MSDCFVAVPRDAVEWLKTNYPALCEKSGLAERIGDRLYTKTALNADVAEEMQELRRQYDERGGIVELSRSRIEELETQNGELVTACRQAVYTIKGREHTGFLDRAILRATTPWRNWMPKTQGDSPENTTDNPQSVAAWRKRALDAETALRALIDNEEATQPGWEERITAAYKLARATLAQAGGAQSAPQDAPSQFAEWLAHQMPSGTVISDPAWWAPRIYRAAIAAKEST